MRNPYIHDLFYEGLGDIFYNKLEIFLNKKIKNPSLLKFLITLHKICYIIFLTNITKFHTFKEYSFIIFRKYSITIKPSFRIIFMSTNCMISFTIKN